MCIWLLRCPALRLCTRRPCPARPPAPQATKVVRARLLSVQNKAVKADRNEQRATFNEYKYVLIQVGRGDAVLGCTPCVHVRVCGTGLF